MKNYKELEELVQQWAKDKGILDKATPLTQHSKTIEEVEEISEALFAQNNNLETFKNSKGVDVDTVTEIKDGIGDVAVTLIIQCAIQNITLEECLEQAYNVISKRKGKMVNGVFVKEAEEEKELFTFNDKFGLDKKFEDGETIWESGNFKGSLGGYTNGEIEDFLLDSEVIKLKK